MKKLIAFALLLLMVFTSCKKEVGEGPELFAKNHQLPVLTTLEATSITTTTAISGGEFISNGNIDIINKGVCWSETTSPVPIVYNNQGLYIVQKNINGEIYTRTTDGPNTTNFTSNLSGLKPGTTYYYRTYATFANPYKLNGTDIAYGNELKFTTM